MTAEIRYRPDGSIDTDHYMKIGRQMRSEQAMSLLSGQPQETRPRRKSFRLFSFF